MTNAQDDPNWVTDKYSDPEWISEKMFGEIPDDDPIVFLPSNDEEPF